MFRATKRDRADVVALLLDLGMSPDVEDEQKQRALHIAGYDGATHVARLLIDRGAEIDPVESNWQNTPIDAAVYAQQQAMIDLLAAYSRDIGNLVFTGQVERVRAVLAESPEKATVVWSDGTTPLMWLPDDEERAMEIVRLFLAHGADPSVRDAQGKTAADRAARRGLEDVARFLRSHGG